MLSYYAQWKVILLQVIFWLAENHSTYYVERHSTNTHPGSG